MISTKRWKYRLRKLCSFCNQKMNEITFKGCTWNPIRLIDAFIHVVKGLVLFWHRRQKTLPRGYKTFCPTQLSWAQKYPAH